MTRLTEQEFQAMNHPVRAWLQRTVELPLFRRMGLDVAGKDLLEIGCGIFPNGAM